jgi:superfamily I DNA and/or RNA helicase
MATYENLPEPVVLTPYKFQKNVIIQETGETYSALTIEQYQGSESDLVLASLVRKNIEGRIGFLKEFNRLYVALSRAKKKLVVVMNRSTFEGSAVFSPFFNYVDSGKDRIAYIMLSQNSINEIHQIASSLREG